MWQYPLSKSLLKIAYYRNIKYLFIIQNNATGNFLSETSEKWNQRYDSAPDDFPEATLVLQDFSHLLPQGDALDLACGLGGNALFLASTKLSVQAWDISSVAIDKLNRHATSKHLFIQTEVRDVVALPPQEETFDVIIVSYFLHRALAKSLCAALRPNGLLFYQTFTRNKVSETGPKNPDFLLSKNELLELFGNLQLLAYREEGKTGDIKKGLRNEALLIGQKV